MNNQLDFSNTSLIPRVISTIESRNDIDTSVKFNDIISLSSPIIASPMKDVCNAQVAKKIKMLGGLGIIHRFMSIDEQVDEFNNAESPLVCGCAISVNNDDLLRFFALYNSGCQIFLVDTANGANTAVERLLTKLSGYKIDVIVGNVASKECYKWVQDLPNVRAIRVGISGGYACTTKNATGIYHPMISCIQECAEVKSEKTLLIADGGIKEPSDMCKAIAYGADLVMMGSLIAKTSDSPAELIQRDGKFYKVYHGSASYEIQKEYRENPKYIEGRTRLLEYDGESLEGLVARFCDGLRSSMSYFDARNIKEYQKNVRDSKV